MAFDDLDAVIGAGTIEERRELVRPHAKRIEADPTVHTVQISLYPALFTSIIAGTRFLPHHIMRIAFWSHASSVA